MPEDTEGSVFEEIERRQKQAYFGEVFHHCVTVVSVVVSQLLQTLIAEACLRQMLLTWSSLEYRALDA